MTRSLIFVAGMLLAGFALIYGNPSINLYAGLVAIVGFAAMALVLMTLVVECIEDN